MNEPVIIFKANFLKIKELLCAGFLLMFAVSCYSYKTLSSEKEIKEYASANYNAEVLKVITTDNDTIAFSDLKTGVINTNNITGIPTYVVSFENVDSLKIIDGRLVSFTYMGETFISFEQSPSGFIVPAHDSVMIPLNEIKSIYVRKLEVEKVVIPVVITASFVALLIYAATHFTISLGMGI